MWARGGAERRAGPRRNQGRDQGRWGVPLAGAGLKGGASAETEQSWATVGAGIREQDPEEWARVGAGKGGSFRWGQGTGKAWEGLWCVGRIGASPDPGVARC